MFFEFELLRRGQKLHLVWKSATLGINKLKRKDVLSVNVCQSCNYILKFIVTDSRRPRDRFSLVLSSKLISGLARILDKQSDLLLKDIWAFLAIVRKPIIFAVIEDISDVFAVPKPTKRPRTKRKAPIVTEEVEAEPEVQPVTDISLTTLRELTELPQRSILEEFMDLGTGEEPEFLATQRAASKIDVTTEVEVEPLPQQKRAPTDIGFISVAKVPKRTTALSIEEARKETPLQIAEVSEIIPAEITVEHPKEPEPQPATKVPEAAKATFIQPKPKKQPARNKLLIVLKAKKRLLVSETKLCVSTPHIKEVPEESLVNWIRNSKIDFNDLFAKFSNAAEEIEAQRAGEFSKDSVGSRMSSLKLPSSSTSHTGSVVHPSLKKISNLPEVIPLSPVVEPQTVFAEVHEPLLGRTTNGHDVSQSLMEEKDMNTRERLRIIVRKIMNFEERNNVHATLEDIAQRPFTKLIIAKLFNDLLSLAKLQYVKLVSKENSLEFGHIVLGPKTLQ